MNVGSAVEPSSRVIGGRGPRRAGRGAVLLVALAAMLLITSCLPPVTKLGRIEAVRFPETSDPFIVAFNKKHYMYGSNNHLRALITFLDSIEEALSLQAKNARTIEGMPAKPAWAARADQLWAPTVARFGTRWVMFFAADRPNPPQPHNAQCIGRAFATSPTGPFVPEARALDCGLGGTGGALDPEVFTDTTGQRYLLMALGDTEWNIQIARLDANANMVGAPKAILKRQQPWEHHFLEQPSMVWDSKRKNYVLTYSAGEWFKASYSIGIAGCTTPMGPCYSDRSGPWVASSNGRSGPGALSFFRDNEGAQRAVFATFAAGRETTVGGRSASVMYVRFDPAVAMTVVK